MSKSWKEAGESFLGQTLITVMSNEKKWVVTFVGDTCPKKEYNSPLLYPTTRQERVKEKGWSLEIIITKILIDLEDE